MLSTSTSRRRRSHFDVDPDAYTRIMHAHTSAQLAATAFPPVVSASPHATSAARIPTPPDSSKPPIRVSDNKTIVVEAPPCGGNSDGSNSDSDSDSSDSAGIDSAAKRCSPVEFDAKNLHIPVQKSRSPEEVKMGGVGVEGQGRRKSEGAAAALMKKLGMGWAMKWEGGVGEAGELHEKAVGPGAEGQDKARRGSTEWHAPTRLKCNCDGCEGCRVRKRALARNGLCMGAAAAGRRETA